MLSSALRRTKNSSGECVEFRSLPQYLVAIHHPDDYDPSNEGEAMARDIDVLNAEMEAAGARFFAGGLQSAPHAKSLRKQRDAKVLVTDAGSNLWSRDRKGAV